MTNLLGIFGQDIADTDAIKMKFSVLSSSDNTCAQCFHGSHTQKRRLLVPDDNSMRSSNTLDPSSHFSFLVNGCTFNVPGGCFCSVSDVASSVASSAASCVISCLPPVKGDLGPCFFVGCTPWDAAQKHVPVTILTDLW